MTEQYRVRLVKRDGGKTQPVNVHLDPEMKASELKQHLVGLVRSHDLEWGSDPDRWVGHYGLEVLHKRTDDVLHVFRTRE